MVELTSPFPPGPVEPVNQILPPSKICKDDLPVDPLREQGLQDAFCLGRLAAFASCCAERPGLVMGPPALDVLCSHCIFSVLHHCLPPSVLLFHPTDTGAEGQILLWTEVGN